MAGIYLKQNDTHQPIKATFKTPLGDPVNLTGAMVVFYMSKNGTLLIAREADIMDTMNGKVSFSFVEGETAETGVLQAEFKVIYPDGTTETFPNSGYITITIEKDLSDVEVVIEIINGGTFLNPDDATDYDGGVF